jgi:hypothetical protein
MEDTTTANNVMHLINETNEEENALIDKNFALEWAQTIGRLCGREQLKQVITHFGTDTSDELRDYLVVQKRWKGDPCHHPKTFNNTLNHHQRRQLFRRMNPFHGRFPSTKNINAEGMDYDDDNVSIPDSVVIIYSSTRVDL